MTSPLPAEVFARVAEREGAVWLDSSGLDARWSVLTWSPRRTCTDPGQWQDFLRAEVQAAGASGVPFAGGVLGYLGYGVGATVESVPAEPPSDEPPLWLGRFDGALCFDHRAQRWHNHGTASWRREAAQVLAAAQPLPAPTPPRASQATTVDRRRYEADVERILAWIAAGDCYQVNLSRPVWVRGVTSALDAYRRLRTASPAAYGALLHPGDDLWILSNSPELLVSSEGASALAEPIKGTRPRHPDPSRDAREARELLASDKERAELTMIVDLLRNDLGKVARPGGVRAGARVLRSHGQVHHTHQPVHAALRDDVDAVDLLAALLPYGSITGAPKVRACQRIAELEPYPRGVYCGAIGYVADGGSSAWSVAIRTAVQRGDTVRYHVGGGIVAESEPSAEWEETVAKARAMALALHPGLQPCASSQDAPQPTSTTSGTRSG